MDIKRTFCPICGHLYKRDEWGLNFEDGLIHYHCTECEYDCNEHEVINSTKIENDLYEKLSDYGIEDTEITELNISNVMTLIEDGEEYENAISFVSTCIKDSLARIL